MGFIEKRPGESGYRARYLDPLGRKHSRTFARKADAQRFLVEMEADKARGAWIDPRGADMPLAAWVEEFLLLARRLSPTTVQTYRRGARRRPGGRHLTRYVLPRFGGYRIGRLPADEIENWLNDEVAAGIAPQLGPPPLPDAAARAPSGHREAAPPREPVRPGRAAAGAEAGDDLLSWEQVVELAEAHSERFRPLIYLAVDSGMRWSELIGLRRSRVDLRNGKVRVTEQLVRLDTGEWLRKEPKTGAAVRSITISAFTAEVLAKHLECFAEPGVDGLVFPNGAGKPVASPSFYNQHFRRALERAGIRCRFHDLRHSSVALAIAEGAHPKAIQARMGHSSINVTLDRYGHLFPELDEAIATAFGGRLAAAHVARSSVVVHASFGKE